MYISKSQCLLLIKVTEILSVPAASLSERYLSVSFALYSAKTAVCPQTLSCTLVLAGNLMFSPPPRDLWPLYSPPREQQPMWGRALKQTDGHVPTRSVLCQHLSHPSHFPTQKNVSSHPCDWDYDKNEIMAKDLGRCHTIVNEKMYISKSPCLLLTLNHIAGNIEAWLGGTLSKTNRVLPCRGKSPYSVYSMTGQRKWDACLHSQIQGSQLHWACTTTLSNCCLQSEWD